MPVNFNSLWIFVVRRWGCAIRVIACSWRICRRSANSGAAGGCPVGSTASSDFSGL